MIRHLLQSQRRRLPTTALRYVSGEKSDVTDWIPPNRPLVGDQQHGAAAAAALEAENAELQRMQKEIDQLDNPTIVQDEDTSVDWLATRKKMLGGGGLEAIKGLSRHEDLVDVAVKHHTLLSKDEIVQVLDSLGGLDIKVIYDNPLERRMGGNMGMILATASRASQMRILADTLVRQMRLRKLQDVDVFGAQQGPEGTEESNWMVVDCRNFVVHIMDDHMRRMINLEGLWSGKDPLPTVSFYDDDAVEDYVAAHPVPEKYGAPVFDWDNRFRELQKNRWMAPHNPVEEGMKRPKKKGRRGRSSKTS
jgi:ribosomal silencing factor RsfS